MAEEQRTDRAEIRSARRRQTIGLIMDNLYGVTGYHNILWQGIVDAAAEHGINLIAFAGGTLRFSPTNEFEDERNIVYGLASADTVDGVILGSATMRNFVTAEEYKGFHTRFHPLPTVSIGALEGVPSVTVDNEKGLHDALAHLITHHGYRRIAFIRGVEHNEDAEQRYRVYQETLAEHGLPFDPQLVAPGLFIPSSGAEAVRLFLDERNVRPEAIAAANDNMAFGALEELQARGIFVPYDMAVIGFDDLPLSNYATPPLTTVRQPVYEQGKQAVETLMALLAGKEVPERIALPTEFVLRQSCGCLPKPTQLLTPLVSALPAGAAWASHLAAQREHILADMAQAAGLPPANQDTLDRLSQVLNASLAVVQDTEETPRFLQALDNALRHTGAHGYDVGQWQDAISVLRSHLLPTLTDPQTLQRAATLLEQARILIGGVEQRAQAQRIQREREQTETLRDVSQALAVTFDLQELETMIRRQLPRLRIKGCHISLYEHGAEPPPPKKRPAQPAEGWQLEPLPSEWAWQVVTYDESIPAESESSRQRYPCKRLMPDSSFLDDRQHCLVVDGLHFREEQIGFVLFETGPTEGNIYEMLRAQISAALKGALLVKQAEERSHALQEANYALQRRAIELEASAAVSRAITSIFDLDQLMLETVNLIRDRFGFYHAGIFLIDESGEWAVLREATGEAGAKMKAQGHRLAVGDTSMVGWTAAHRQPRVALDVGEDAVRFANPLLPYTRSEMTLPLLVGNKLLGVLNVQSTEEAAFDQDDVRALQAMADQIAIAIENAQRISDEAALLEATSPIYRASRLLTTATTTQEVANAIITSVSETGADGCTVVEFEFSPSGEPEALLYLGVWRNDREPQFQPGMRLSISESPFPLEMVSSLWSVADVNQDDRLPHGARLVFQATGAQALANIPLRSGEKVIGQVVVIRNTPGPFPNTAMRLYEVLSDQAAVALERAKLLEEAQRRAAREQMARRMVDRIRQAVDVEEALQTAAEELAQAMEVPHISIQLAPGTPTQT